jgi:peptidyl-prolyl cis-trans isomerase D
MALGFMRKHHGLLKLSLIPLLVGFIWIYVPSLLDTQASGAGEVLGRVGDRTITVGEFQKAYFRQRQQVSQMTKGRTDPELMRRLGVPDRVFEQLVTGRLMLIEAQRQGISVDDAAVAKSIQSDPYLQRDGHSLSGPEIRHLLAGAGISEEDFVEDARARLIQNKLETLVTAGVSVSPEEAEREYRNRNEKVKMAYVHVDASRYKDQVTVTDEDARAAFDGKKDAYKFPERRVVSYVLVDPQALQARTAVTPADIQDYYQHHEDDFRQEAQVCASHILVRVKQSPESKDGHTDAEAKEIATGLLAELKGGADFATLAKKSSEDPGSKHNGGDLGCFARGAMVPEFEKVAFDLKAGELSDVVKTSFGYHLIKVASVKPEALQTLDEARDRIRQTLVSEGAEKKAEEQAQRVAGALAKGKSLEEAAKAEGLVVQKSTPFARGDSPQPIASPDLVSRAFELKPGQTAKEPFATQRGLAFIALQEVQAPRLPEWSEVKDKVKADLQSEKEFEKAKEVALEVESRAGKGGLEKAATSLGLVRKETPDSVGRDMPMGDLPSSASLDQAAFSLPVKQVSEPVRVADGYAVLEVLDKKPFDPAAFAVARVGFTGGLEQEKKNRFFQSYIAELRHHVTVEKVPDVWRRAIG